MRRGLGIAGAIAGLVACARFGTDAPETPATIEDAGTTKSDAAVAPATSAAGSDAAVDAGLLPLDAFATIEPAAYDVFDDFERNDALPSAGPFDWKEEFGAQPEGDVIGYETCESASCSKPNVAWGGNDEGGWGFVSSSLRSDAKIIRFDLTMAIGRASHDPKGQAQLVSLQLENDRYIFLEVNGAAFRLGDQYRDSTTAAFNSDFTTLGDAPDNQWAKLRLYVNLSLGVAALEVDGAPSGPIRVLRQPVLTKLLRVRVGVTYAQFDSFHVRFDDVGLKQR